MEGFSAVIPHPGTIASVAWLFGVVVGVFVGAEKFVAPEKLAFFAGYLKSSDFSETVVYLPDGTRALFEHVFGARHFSWRCVKNSVLFSAASFLVIGVLYVLYNPGFVRVVRFEWQFAPVLINMAIARIIWSFVSNYFNLLKTRKVLDLITAHPIKRLSVLVVLLLADFFIGYAIFIITVPTTSMLTLHLFFLVVGRGHVTWEHIVNNVIFSPLPIDEGFRGEYGLLFWPGMVPSIWLWCFILATLIVRVSARSGSALRVSMDWLDGERHPIRFVGIVAAALASIIYGIFLLISEFVAAMSEIT
jgi:hypothetical protein